MNLEKQSSFVVFPIGSRSFALPASLVSELAQPDTPQVFPHTTPLLIGVLVRRGRIVPVCDVAPVLVGPEAPARKFYLIAKRSTASDPDLIAIPVTGECKLVTADMLPPDRNVAEYVIGTILFWEQKIEAVDLDKIMNAGQGVATKPRAAEVPA